MSTAGRTIWRPLIALTMIMLAGASASVLVGGAAALDVGALWRGDPLSASLLWDIRLPRALTAMLVGAGLGVAGAIMQGVLQNDLAEPGILGINAGGSLGVLLVIVLYQSSGGADVFMLPAAAWLGSIAAFAVVLLLSRRRGEIHPVQFLLAGIAVNMLLGTAGSLLELTLPVQHHSIAITWQAGSLGSAGWEQVQVLVPLLAVLLLAAYWQAPTLNVMLVGHQTVQGLGIHVGRRRLSLLVLALGLSGCCVAVGGAMAFVGLLAPHIGRRLLGPNYRLLIPCSILIGASLTVIADLVARTIFLPSQLPTGIVLAVLGVPYFLYLLKRT